MRGFSQVHSQLVSANYLKKPPLPFDEPFSYRKNNLFGPTFMTGRTQIAIAYCKVSK